MSDADRIAALESALVDLWGAATEAFITSGPEATPAFLKIDRRMRELGLLPTGR